MLKPKRCIAAFVVCGALAVLLISAVIFQFAFKFRELPQPKPRERIAEVLPRELNGWTVTDEPLSSTEAANEATLKILNLDDYAYRRFQRGDTTFTVYAAYWGPGRMPTRLVASHTPDRCWTENGMRCVDMRFRESYSVGPERLLPAEYRVFTAAGSERRTYVAYWHTVEGRIYDYGARFNAVPHPWLWWKDTMAQAAYGSREQLFVRIASETPFEQLWRDNGFQAVMKTVADLGVWESAAQ